MMNELIKYQGVLKELSLEKLMMELERQSVASSDRCLGDENSSSKVTLIKMEVVGRFNDKQ